MSPLIPCAIIVTFVSPGAIKYPAANMDGMSRLTFNKDSPRAPLSWTSVLGYMVSITGIAKICRP